VASPSLSLSARRLDGPTRDIDLPATGASGYLLDGRAVLVAGVEIHLGVGARWVGPQDLFDLAHPLEGLAPVDLGEPSQAADGAGDGYLGGGVASLLLLDHLVYRHAPLAFQLGPDRFEGGGLAL